MFVHPGSFAGVTPVRLVNLRKLLERDFLQENQQPQGNVVTGRWIEGQ